MSQCIMPCYKIINKTKTVQHNKLLVLAPRIYCSLHILSISSHHFCQLILKLPPSVDSNFVLHFPENSKKPAVTFLHLLLTEKSEIPRRSTHKAVLFTSKCNSKLNFPISRGTTEARRCQKRSKKKANVKKQRT